MSLHLVECSLYQWRIRKGGAVGRLPLLAHILFFKKPLLPCKMQWRRAIEALEARAPPDGVATLVNSLQNRVKSITLCVILNAKNGK